MPEEIEIETRELQETIDELREERKERETEEKRSHWTRYIGLSTAILAVFAAIGAMKSGALVNEAMILQIKSSDKWNEYQAARQKDHLYTLQANSLLDIGTKLIKMEESAHPEKPHAAQTETVHGHDKPAAPKPTEKRKWSRLDSSARLKQYIGKAESEAEKEGKLKHDAEEFERESQHAMHGHHGFAQSVAFIQVAIALSAVAALTRLKPVWLLSVVAGLVGIFYFVSSLAKL